MNKKTTTNATFPIPIDGLANHLNRSSFPDSVIAMLKDDPLEAELVVLRLLKNYFWAVKTDLSITSIKFRDLDKENVTNAVAYFDFTVTGSKTEIAKIIGKGKFLHYAKA